MAQRPAGKSEPQKKPAPKKPAAAKKAAGSATPAKRPPAKRPSRKASKTDSGTIPQFLTARESRFVDEYLVDLNATQAAIRAGYSAKTARSIACENLTKPHIGAAIAEARKQQQERTHVTADRVLAEAWNILTADPRELVEIKTGCCRHCYGEGHRFQRTVGEMNLDREVWLDKGKPPEEFDEQGGIGFNPLLLPSTECPQCGGDGQSRLVVKDTRKLSPQARALYAGAKEGKYGIEVLTHDKINILEKLFKYTGLYEVDNRQKAEALASMLPRVQVEFVTPPKREDDDAA
ncbi:MULTISPECIES: terminase small subunit [unclassified Delftia]|uniref:terminase small subunit n=1 Tax=unclassified Delftia TaxID=2613839 RepID=UPI001901ED3D|nr:MULTISPECIES: terminase small subunit [unclassified Delftia]MBK0115629.1 terminase small subunit [Delftia sp. S65]MBK0119514.1 terminase small subunit [Delftia sp. S67]MBK0130182.1 terminase small subunit [Delftia sp. S66]